MRLVENRLIEEGKDLPEYSNPRISSQVVPLLAPTYRVWRQPRMNLLITGGTGCPDLVVGKRQGWGEAAHVECNYTKYQSRLPDNSYGRDRRPTSSRWTQSETREIFHDFDHLLYPHDVNSSRMHVTLDDPTREVISFNLIPCIKYCYWFIIKI